jgi:hypothetical protein
MNKNRDNFTRSTVDILAKRVGYLCSNPNCRRPTVGANKQNDKSTIIGIGAHITAASYLGPRFDNSLTPEQRRHIDNGIWLCSNCATLIDKDEEKYSPELLRIWKEQAEYESSIRLLKEIGNHHEGYPFLEADLIWTSGARLNKGYSTKNPVEFHNGIPVYNVTINPIIYWQLIWNFNFVIYNNSSFPAFNIKIENIGEISFSKFDKLPRINNLPPFKNIDLRAKYEDFVEGDHTIADNILNSKIPEVFVCFGIKLSYFDQARNIHHTLVEFSENEIINRKI